MTLDGPVLHTERLTLSPPDAARDFDAFAEMAADAETMAGIGMQPHDRAQAWRMFAFLVGHWALRGFGFFCVHERETGAFVGRLGPWFPECWPDHEVGWMVARPYWGRGYAGEGAAACIDWAFDALGWARVVHCIEAKNDKSQRVAEKLGSRNLGETVTLPALGVEVELWGQSKRDWAARRARG